MPPDLSKPAAPFIVPRKPAASVVSINNARAAGGPQGAGPQGPDNTPNAPNQHTRRAFLTMAVGGFSFDSIVRANKRDHATRANVMATFREEMIEGGVIDRLRKKAA